MERRRFPAGVQDFETIRSGGFVYVDKTEYVYRLANNYGNAIFLSRPRRFGKSLLCSTLKYYFLGRRDLFEGLAIDRLEKDWTRYPVFHFDMSRCKNDDPHYVKVSLNSILADFEKKYGLNNEELSFGGRLEKLIIAAHERTGHRAVLIFDEYDSPVLNVIDEPEKLQVIRSIYNTFYGPVKNMAEHLRFVFLTGITKFSQMSIFSTINNLRNFSMLEEMEPICGITQQELEENFQPEIERMAVKFDTDRDGMLEMLRERYDGYRFGPGLTEIYNPFSLIIAFDERMLKDYWFSSATPSALLKVLEMYNFSIKDLEQTKMYDYEFDQPFDNMESAVPILYQSGYLTIKDYDKRTNRYTLAIPNGEVHRGLFNTLMPLYLNPSRRENITLVSAVQDAILDDDIDAALEAVKNYMSSLPYDLSNKTERDFETILKIVFDCVGIETLTEVRNARGRCDVTLKNRHTIYVLELKIDGAATVDDALAQINERDYLIPYWNDRRRKVKVGVVVDPEARTLKEWKVAGE